MSSFELSKREFLYSTYDAGYISYLISKLMHAYESFKYDTICLQRIGIPVYVLKPRTNNNVPKRNVEVRILTKSDVKGIDQIPDKFCDSGYTFLPSSDLIRRSNGVVHGFDEETLKRYPYIQEFIDFIYNCRIRLKDDVLFVKGLNKLLNQFLMYKYDETNQYIIKHFKDPQDMVCMINRANFFNSIEHVVKTYEDALACHNDLNLIKVNEGPKKVVDLMQRFVFVSFRYSFEITLHAGKFDEENKEAIDYYNQSDLDVQSFVLLFAAQKGEVLQELSSFRMFLKKLYLKSKDKKQLDDFDLQKILVEIKDEHKSRVHSRTF